MFFYGHYLYPSEIASWPFVNSSNIVITFCNPLAMDGLDWKIICNIYYMITLISSPLPISCISTTYSPFPSNELISFRLISFWWFPTSFYIVILMIDLGKHHHLCISASGLQVISIPYQSVNHSFKSIWIPFS